MSSPSRSPEDVAKNMTNRRMRFGLFTFDCDSGELFRGDRRLRIQQQCAAILAAFLEHPGEVVTREQLRQRLWPADTFVDFEDGLNTVVRKLRAALSDDADNPRFIETVPRKGYRFIAPVASAGEGQRIGPQFEARPTTPESDRLSFANLRRWTLSFTFIVVAGALAFWQWDRAHAFPHTILITQLTHSGVVHPNQNLATDGSRLYYIEREHGDWILQSMALTGGSGTAVQLALPRYDLQDISQDESEFLLRKLSTESDDSSIWISPIVGGAARRVGDVAVLAAAFGPDRKTITYSIGDSVYLCSREGRDSRLLFKGDGNVDRVRWSPDGEVLAYTLSNSRTHQTSIWETRANGTDRHELLPNWNLPKWEWMIGWSPDGRWLTFSADRGNGRDIWLTDRRGREPVRLTTGPLRFDLPVFSRDGRTIFAIGRQQRGELLRYDVASGTFSPALGGISAEQVDYSPDGKRVTYVSYPERILWVANPDGSAATKLTDVPIQAAHPKFSKDGTSIAFLARNDRSSPWTVFIIPADGGTAKPVPMGAVESAGFSWFGDGRSILLSCTPCEQLRVVNPETGNYSLIPNSAGLQLPRVSPSGRYIVGENGSSQTLELLDTQSGVRSRVAVDALYGAWSADGKYIYFNRFHGSHPAMFRVRLSDRQEEVVFRLKDFPPAGSMSMYSGINPDGSVLVLRDLGGADVFAIQLSKD